MTVKITPIPNIVSSMMMINKMWEDITLLNIFLAVEDHTDLFSIHGNTNHDCPVGAKIENTLKHLYGTIQTATEEKLSAITLADITKEFHS